ncbi:hypothetical protein PUN28_000056 [Cardiocondyla obscurior]|uniref:Uncharacterized protein n=1 Tax=Cardiocondyla obscurior TaxID=286306 RepID=A0AAW2GXJ7_9HYME
MDLFNIFNIILMPLCYNNSSWVISNMSTGTCLNFNDRINFACTRTLYDASLTDIIRISLYDWTSNELRFLTPKSRYYKHRGSYLKREEERRATSVTCYRRGRLRVTFHSK